MRSPRLGRSAGLALVLFVVLVAFALGISHINSGIRERDADSGVGDSAVKEVASVTFNEDSNPGDDVEGPADEGEAVVATMWGEEAQTGLGAFAGGNSTVPNLQDVFGVGGPIGTESAWPEELITESEDESSEVATETEEPAKPEPITDYVVQPGDSVWTIARAHGVDVDTVAAANGLVHVDRIRPGEKLIVPTERGVVYEVEEGEALSVIARRHGVNVRDVVEVNGLGDADRLRVGQVLLLPGATPRPPGELVVWNGKLQPVFRRPVSGGWISSRFGRRWGRRHDGVDIAVVTGTPVRAAVPGVVSFSGRNGGYGNLIVIDHGSGVETRYGHNSRLVARVGQRVKTGQIVAYSGNTGNSTGPHVHFEIRRNGMPVDPLQYLYD